MSSDALELRDLKRRVDRLEKQNRWLKRLGAAALVVAAALGTMAATRPVPQKIVAHEFEVVDGSGKVRIKLTQKRGFAAVEILDTAGDPDVYVADDPTVGPGVSVVRPGRLAPSVSIGITPTGQPNVLLLDSKDQNRAALSLSATGEPTIVLSDPEGYSMDLGSTSLITPTTGETHHTSADSIVMFGKGKDHRVIWQAPEP